MMGTPWDEENTKHGAQGSEPYWHEDVSDIIPVPGEGRQIGARTSAPRSSKSDVQNKAEGKSKIDLGTE